MLLFLRLLRPSTEQTGRNNIKGCNGPDGVHQRHSVHTFLCMLTMLVKAVASTATHCVRLGWPGFSENLVIQLTTELHSFSWVRRYAKVAALRELHAVWLHSFMGRCSLVKWLSGFPGWALPGRTLSFFSRPACPWANGAWMGGMGTVVQKHGARGLYSHCVKKEELKA